MRAGIVGAGIGGRLLALGLAERGWDVCIYDKDTEEGREQLLKQQKQGRPDHRPEYVGGSAEDYHEHELA